MAAFSQDSKRMLVLTDDQKVYTLNVAAPASTVASTQ
jgi:hypothetical protein